jgi:hypothetical protein
MLREPVYANDATRTVPEIALETKKVVDSKSEYPQYLGLVVLPMLEIG